MERSFSKRLRFFCISMCLAFLVLACLSGGKSTPPGANAVYGSLGETSYLLLHWKEGLRVMILCDITGNVQSSGHGSTEDPIHRQVGYAADSDGRRIDWQLETADGKTATFKMNEQPYDLSKGSLFLVTTKGGKTRVQQLDTDLSTIQPTNEGCQAFAKSDPDIRKFIEEAGKAE